MKKPKLTEEDYVNWWLMEFHNTNLDRVKKLHPEWGDNDNAKFTEEYAVTEDQYNQWSKWLVDALAKEHGVSRKYAEKYAWPLRLSFSPTIKRIK